MFSIKNKIPGRLTPDEHLCKFSRSAVLLMRHLTGEGRPMHGAGLPQLDVKEEGTVRDDVSAWVCEMELQACRLLPWKDLRVIHKEKGSNMQSSDIVKCGKLSEEQKALAVLPHGVKRKVHRKANEERRSQLKAFADGDVKWIPKEVLETTDVKVLETTGPPERKMPQARTSRAAER